LAAFQFFTPSVTVIVPTHVLFPTLTKCLIATNVVLVIEETVAASTALGNIVLKRGAVVVRQLPLVSFLLFLHVAP
jgi:hypothetical protein